MSILEQIIVDKKIEVAERKRIVPQADLEKLIAREGQPPRFAKKLASGGIHLIAEVKKASPSAGLLRPDFDPVAIAKAYELAGASCVSVLTDEKYFQGKLADLDAVRAAIGLPVLRKDFIIDAYQLYEAKAHHADAVLLIVAALGSYVLERFLGLCATLSLDALVEVHDAPELQTALVAGSRLIGINARDLKDFKVDPELAEKLVARIPKDILVVCESGIKNTEDLARVKKLPVHGVLVGEALMRSGDVATQTSAFVAALRSS
jgi:indole-3-glycerol phosphate synthase